MMTVESCCDSGNGRQSVLCCAMRRSRCVLREAIMFAIGSGAFRSSCCDQDHSIWQDPLIEYVA